MIAGYFMLASVNVSSKMSSVWCESKSQITTRPLWPFNSQLWKLARWNVTSVVAEEQQEVAQYSITSTHPLRLWNPSP